MKLFHKIFGVTSLDDISERLERAKQQSQSTESTEPQSREVPVPEKRYIGYLAFYVSPEGEVEIKTDCATKVENINLFAALLFLVSSGKLKEDIVNTILALSENPNASSFLEPVLQKWEQLCIHDNEMPLVRPLVALKENKGGEQ